MHRGATAIALAVFTAASCVLIALLCGDLRPAPVYAALAPNPKMPIVRVSAARDVEISVDLPGTAPSALLLPVVVPSAQDPLEVELRDAATGRLLLASRIERSGAARLPLGAELAGVSRVSLTLRSSTARWRKAPGVLWASVPPAYAAQVRIGGGPVLDLPGLPATGPLLRWVHAWPTRALLGLWLPVAAGFVWARSQPRRHLAFLVLLGLAAAATSGLLWQAHYSRFVGHLDADDYGLAARTLADWAVDPGAREAARAWLREYPQASTALVPALLAPALALGVPLAFAYLELSSLASFAALLLFHRILRARKELSPAAALGLAAVFGTHLLVLRAFARPIPDAAGLLLTVATFAALLARLETRSRGPLLALGALALLHPLARPQGFGYWPFVAGALAACDAWREGRRPRPGEVLRTQLAVFGVPLLLLGALYLGFGWRHNLALMLEKAAWFRGSNSLLLLAGSLIGTCQLLPLLWPWRRSALRDPWTRLFGAWLVFYLALLVAARAPFWMRHFLPIVPAAVALAAAGWRGQAPLRGRAAAALLTAGAVANVAATLYLVFGEFDPPFALGLLISSP